MDAYSGFAEVYDDLMTDVDYQKWFENTRQLLSRHGANPKRVLELACGTGNMSIQLAENGYDVTGLDLSEDMLVMAQEKAMDWFGRVRFLQMDMRQITIRDRYDVALSFCDGFNYLLTADDLHQAFNSIADRLHENGLLVFDISTAYKLAHVIGDRTIAEAQDDVAFIWENAYDPERRMLAFDLTVFVESDDNGLFERHQEHHIQKGHTVEEVQKSMEGSFELLEVVDAETLEQPSVTSERIYFVARKR